MQIQSKFQLRDNNNWYLLYNPSEHQQKTNIISNTLQMHSKFQQFVGNGSGKALASGTSPKFKTKMMSELPSLELLSTTKNFDWCVYALIILLPTGYGREGKIPHSDPVKVPGHGSWVEVVSRGRKGASVRLKSSYQSKIAVSLHALLNGPWVV